MKKLIVIAGLMLASVIACTDPYADEVIYELNNEIENVDVDEFGHPITNNNRDLTANKTNWQQVDSPFTAVFLQINGLSDAEYQSYVDSNYNWDILNPGYVSQEDLTTYIDEEWRKLSSVAWKRTLSNGDIEFAVKYKISDFYQLFIVKDNTIKPTWRLYDDRFLTDPSYDDYRQDSLAYEIEAVTNEIVYDSNYFLFETILTRWKYGEIAPNNGNNESPSHAVNWYFKINKGFSLTQPNNNLTIPDLPKLGSLYLRAGDELTSGDLPTILPYGPFQEYKFKSSSTVDLNNMPKALTHYTNDLDFWDAIYEVRFYSNLEDETHIVYLGALKEDFSQLYVIKYAGEENYFYGDVGETHVSWAMSVDSNNELISWLDAPLKKTETGYEALAILEEYGDGLYQYYEFRFDQPTDTAPVNINLDYDGANGGVVEGITATRVDLGLSHIEGHNEYSLQVFIATDGLVKNLDATAHFYFGDNAHDPGAYSGSTDFVQTDGGYIAKWNYYDTDDSLEWIIKVDLFGKTYNFNID